MIDSHALVQSPDVARYPVAPGVVVGGAGVMSVERLLQEMARHDVSRATLVQRVATYGFDNSYVCDASREHPESFTAVCAVDSRRDDAAELLRYWIVQRGAVGVRFMEPEKGADLSWLAGDGAQAMWRVAGDLDIPVDVHFFGWNRLAGLAVLLPLLKRFPRTTVVVNNLSNIDVLTGPPDFGVDPALAGLADFAQVRLKFTTIPLGAVQDASRDLSPVLRRVAGAFGAERLLWGSDVPVGGRSYEQMVGLGLAAVAGFTAEERHAALHASAAAIYRAR